MRSLLVIFLILLVLGLYFFTEPTKSVIRTTGKAVAEVSKGVFEEVKNSQEYENLKQDIKNKTKEIIKGG